jgi:fibronectin type 3 domain-containing protein
MSGSGYAATGISANETLAAGQSASMTVVFTPTTASTSSGSISVSSNASNSPLTIGLSGTGVQAAQPSVTLSWSASTSSSVAGYNVYRSTVSGGPYTTLLNGSLVTGLTFTDTNVQAGATYYYVVVAVNSNGVESSDSNQASATIP